MSSSQGNHVVVLQGLKQIRGSEQVPACIQEAAEHRHCTGSDWAPATEKTVPPHSSCCNPALNKRVGLLMCGFEMIPEASQSLQADKLVLSGH